LLAVERHIYMKWRFPGLRPHSTAAPWSAA
jgi:hypothetical protein